MSGRGRAVPATVTRPALALAATALALFGVARTTGSGWLIVILTGVATVVGLSALLPWFGLRTATVSADAPRDATVGRPLELSVDVGGGSRPLKLLPLGFDTTWTGVVAPCRGTLLASPRRRGVVTSIAIEVRSAAPLGLVWWRRRITVELRRPIEVGPAPATATDWSPQGGEESGSEAGKMSSVLADAVRTIREYVAGDPIKLVNWAATARAGQLMVKELESPITPVLLIAVDLRSAIDDAVERAASRAAGLALSAIGAGVPVVLLTAETTGPRIGPVSAPVEVGRRLARAVGGPLPDPPRGTSPLVISATEIAR